MTACALALLWLSSAAPVLADGPIKLGINAQQYGPRRARVDAHINASAAAKTDVQSRGRTQVVKVTVRTTDAGGPNLPPLFPSLSTRAPILRTPQPGGPGSFWYTDTGGHACEYIPGTTVAPCFTLVGSGASRSAGRLSPVAVAQSLARHVDLIPGEIKTSPARAGLAGAQAWFWLDPAPRRQSLSISLAGETVSVTADPVVNWRFGDGASLDAGPGVPYQAGAAPTDAITHVYETRCLSGDQGRDPYVLPSCGQSGYTLDALVVGRITYTTSGPIVASGTLPTRTTETSMPYPVSESRAFLVSGGGSQ